MSTSCHLVFSYFSAQTEPIRFFQAQKICSFAVTLHKIDLCNTSRTIHSVHCSLSRSIGLRSWVSQSTPSSVKYKNGEKYTRWWAAPISGWMSIWSNHFMIGYRSNSHWSRLTCSHLISTASTATVDCMTLPTCYHSNVCETGGEKRNTNTSSRTREQCDRMVAWIKCAVSARALQMNSALFLFSLERIFCCYCCCCVSAAILFSSVNKRIPCAPRLTLRHRK